MEIQEIPLQHKKKLCYCENVEPLANIAQTACGVSILGDAQNLTGHNPTQSTLPGSTLSRKTGLDDLQTSLQKLCDSKVQYFTSKI